MSRVHKRSLLLCLILIGSLLLVTGAFAQSGSQSSKDVEINKPLPPPGQSSSSPNKFFHFWFQINPPGQSKKDFDFRPPTSTPKDPSELSELRYLVLGSIDPETALILRLTEKAKQRMIEPSRFGDYLRSQQVSLRGYLSLSNRIHNLILELCLLDLGRISRSEFTNYLRQIRVNAYHLSTEENTFNYLIDLIENNLFSPTEAIDCLILLKHDATSRW
ncbi:MAG: hypothetical protein GX050_03525 [Firmicutes bacterium]|nr:hypothetical protein [Bacillota bacterium]